MYLCFSFSISYFQILSHGECITFVQDYRKTVSCLALHQIITQLSRLKDVGSEMYRFFFQFFHQLRQNHGMGKQHFFSLHH